METKTELLDSAHGWTGVATDRFVLEQYWSVQLLGDDGEIEDVDVVRVTIEYCPHEMNKHISLGELLCLTGETADKSGEFAVRMRAFPSQWWVRLDIEKDGGLEPPELLTEVANNLLQRFVTFCERLSNTGEY